MHRTLALGALAALIASPAQAVTDCGSVKAFRDEQVLEVDGVFFQMKEQSLIKNGKSWRLVGHDMTFVHTPKSDKLISSQGGTRNLTCSRQQHVAAEDNPTGKPKRAFQANSIPTASLSDGEALYDNVRSGNSNKGGKGDAGRRGGGGKGSSGGKGGGGKGGGGGGGGGGKGGGGGGGGGGKGK